MAPWRTAPLPADWPALRRTQLEHDGYRCTWIEGTPDGFLTSAPLHYQQRCPAAAEQVDHYGDPDDHSRLRSLCGPHHRHRTGKQAKALQVKRTKRPLDAHPGFLTNS